MSLYTFWVGWDVDDRIPQDHMVKKWPEGMKGWNSGFGDGYALYTGRVVADTAEAAETIVRSCYGSSGAQIRMRWDPEQHELDWRPTGGRFPE